MQRGDHRLKPNDGIHTTGPNSDRPTKTTVQKELLEKWKAANPGKKLTPETIELIKAETMASFPGQYGKSIPVDINYKDWSKLSASAKQSHVASLIETLKAGGKKVPGLKVAIGVVGYSAALSQAQANGDSTAFAHAKAMTSTLTPVGDPIDVTASWSMNMQQMKETNSGWAALTDTFNPFSPRFLPTQIARGGYGSIIGTKYATEND